MTRDLRQACGTSRRTANKQGTSQTCNKDSHPVTSVSTSWDMM